MVYARTGSISKLNSSPRFQQYHGGNGALVINDCEPVLLNSDVGKHICTTTKISKMFVTFKSDFFFKVFINKFKRIYE